LPRLCAALLSLVFAAAAAGCGSAGSTTSSTPVAAAPSSSQPSAAPTGAPIASAAAVSAAPPGGQTISLYEWSVIVASTIKSGKATYKISNFGTVPHELLVFKSHLDPSAYPIDAAGNIKEEGAGVTLVSDGANIDPAGSQVRTIDLKPGTYLFVCNIPGHFKQGMFVVVTVAS
jgi:hypothetical protein